MVEPEESAYRISTTALALVIGVWGLERQENDPVDHFQRRPGGSPGRSAAGGDEVERYTKSNLK